MTNLSQETRKQQVLSHLRARKGQWVDGPEIANEEVGGSEGHRRLRELRLDGYKIPMRKHPDPRRDIWQYMLQEDGPQPVPRPVTSLRGLSLDQVKICSRCQARGWVVDNRGPGHKRVECPDCKGNKVVLVRPL